MTPCDAAWNHTLGHHSGEHTAPRRYARRHVHARAVVREGGECTSCSVTGPHPALMGWRFLCMCAFGCFLLWFLIAYACLTIKSLCNWRGRNVAGVRAIQTSRSPATPTITLNHPLYPILSHHHSHLVHVLAVTPTGAVRNRGKCRKATELLKNRQVSTQTRAHIPPTLGLDTYYACLVSMSDIRVLSVDV